VDGFNSWVFSISNVEQGISNDEVLKLKRIRRWAWPKWLNNNVGMLDATVAAVSTTGGSEPVWRCAAGRRHGGYRET